MPRQRPVGLCPAVTVLPSGAYECEEAIFSRDMIPTERLQCGIPGAQSGIIGQSGTLRYTADPPKVVLRTSKSGSSSEAGISES